MKRWCKLVKSIRNNVFETNSSSTHSLAIRRNTQKMYDYEIGMSFDGFVYLTFDMDKDFGWGPMVYRDAYNKLNYLACLAFQEYQRIGLEKYEQENPMVLKCKKFNYVNKVICKPTEILEIPDIKKLEREVAKVKGKFNKFAINPKDYEEIFYVANWYKHPVLELSNGGIDHQSLDGFTCIDDFLKTYSISLSNFLFNPEVILYIYNDNVSCPFNGPFAQKKRIDIFK